MGHIPNTYKIASASCDYRNRVLVAQFGDGYAQRSKAGINTLTKVWDVVFTPGTAGTMGALDNTLASDLNWNVTTWQAPDEAAPSNWVPIRMGKKIHAGQIIEISATLERAYP